MGQLPSYEWVFFDLDKNVYILNDVSIYLSENPNNRIVEVLVDKSNPVASGVGLNPADNPLIFKASGNTYHMSIFGGAMRVVTPSGTAPLTTPTLEGDLATKKYVDTKPLDYHKIEISSKNSTTSSSYIPVSGTAFTPASGTYKVSFSASASNSRNKRLGNIALYKNGNIIQDSERDVSTAGYIVGINTQTTINVNGTDTISLHFKINSGSFTIYKGNIVFLKLVH